MKNGRSPFIPAIPGMSFSTLYEVLRRNRFQVDRPYWGRLAILGLLGIMNSLLAPVERVYYARIIRRTKVERPPLFIIGHLRSGTTHLHDLLSLDEGLDCPTVFQALFPHHFCFSQLKGYGIFDRFAPDKRPMDNMPMGSSRSHEDEFALLALSGVSPYLRFLFPRATDDPYAALDPEKLPPDALNAWTKALDDYMRKLAWWKHQKRIALKSPPHLGRVALLLKMFPEAQFIHIVRNPYAVYLSTRRLWFNALSRVHLQAPDPELVDEIILSWHTELFAVFERDRMSVPPDSLVEIKFEDLEDRPIDTLAAAYQALGLPGFDRLKTRLEPYLDSIKDYKKNVFQLDDVTREKVSRRWRAVFERYGYPV
jgi:omega-hydroxy-beta-dihydromenaquinone-9 sulfotransferase